MKREVFVKIVKILLAASVFAMVLSVARSIWAGSANILFLNWNLFLPWFSVLCVFLYLYHYKKKVARYLALFFSFIFLPNAPYLITDFKHLDWSSPIFWLDSVTIFIFAVIGFAIFLLILFVYYLELRKKFSARITILFFFFLSFLVSFGIYLGRSAILRFNSWDLILRPHNLFSSALDVVLHPLAHVQFLSLFLSYGIFFFFSFCLMLYGLKIFRNSNE